jgi:hypothetical protein
MSPIFKHAVIRIISLPFAVIGRIWFNRNDVITADALDPECISENIRPCPFTRPQADEKDWKQSKRNVKRFAFHKPATWKNSDIRIVSCYEKE